MSPYAGRYRPGPCETCESNPERKKSKVRVARVVQAPSAGGGKVMNKKKDACKRCGKVKLMQGRGLCSTCLYQVRKAGELEQWPPLNPSRARRIKEGIAQKKAAAAQKTGPANDGICGEMCPAWDACKDLAPGTLPETCPKLGGAQEQVGNRLAAPGMIELSSNPASGITIVINITAPAGMLCDMFMDELKKGGTLAQALGRLSNDAAV